MFMELQNPKETHNYDTVFLGLQVVCRAVFGLQLLLEGSRADGAESPRGHAIAFGHFRVQSFKVYVDVM